MGKGEAGVQPVGPCAQLKGFQETPARPPAPKWQTGKPRPARQTRPDPSLRAPSLVVQPRHSPRPGRDCHPWPPHWDADGPVAWHSGPLWPPVLPHLVSLPPHARGPYSLPAVLEPQGAARPCCRQHRLCAHWASAGSQPLSARGAPGHRPGAELAWPHLSPRCP